MSRTTKRRTSPKTETRVLAGVTVVLVRGGVKNYNLRVRSDGTIRLSMPSNGSLKLAEQLVRDHLPWIEERKQALKTQTARDASPTPDDIARDAEKLKELLPPLFDRYEQELGVRCARVRLRHMVSRWGSCNVRTHVISINTELARMPLSCVESVVVHELCHLIEPSHNAHFHALMDEHFPAWREARAYLNAHPPRR
jgi:predicted metal-dependent hydrolase